MEADEKCWDDWLNGPACKVGAHPTVFHHQHVIGPATWHCSCGKVTKEAIRISHSIPRTEGALNE